MISSILDSLNKRVIRSQKQNSQMFETNSVFKMRNFILNNEINNITKTENSRKIRIIKYICLNISSDIM